MVERATRLLFSEEDHYAYQVALSVLLNAGTEQGKQVLDSHLVEALGRSTKPWAAIEISPSAVVRRNPSPELLPRLEQLPTFELCFAPGLLWALAARQGERARETLAEPGHRGLRAAQMQCRRDRCPRGPSHGLGACTGRRGRH